MEQQQVSLTIDDNTHICDEDVPRTIDGGTLARFGVGFGLQTYEQVMGRGCREELKRQWQEDMQEEYQKKKEKEEKRKKKAEEERKKYCLSCKRAARAKSPLLTCGACKKVFYCSKQCQVKHWPRHKIFCEKR